MNSKFFFHSFRALVRVRVFFLIQPPTVLKKNLQKILSSNFSSKCRLRGLSKEGENVSYCIRISYAVYASISILYAIISTVLLLIYRNCVLCLYAINQIYAII